MRTYLELLNAYLHVSPLCYYCCRPGEVARRMAVTGGIGGEVIVVTCNSPACVESAEKAIGPGGLQILLARERGKLCPN